MAIIRS